MKALSLWQPWASFVARGLKCVETRSWSTSYRGRLAIGAALRPPQYGEIGGYLVEPWYDDVQHGDECGCEGEGIAPSCTRGARMHMVLTQSELVVSHLPLGAVVATCTLVDVVRTDRIHWEPERFPVKGRIVEWATTAMLGDGIDARIAEDQRPYGDFSPGRFAWLLADIEPVVPPVPAKGRQGLWEWADTREAVH